LSGSAGGKPWEALAGTIGRFEGPIRTPVEITIAGEHSSVRVPCTIDLALAPLPNPVPGDDQEVHNFYRAGGFFSNDAKFATTGTMRAAHGAFQLEWPGRYASSGEVTWTNQK